jgi:hypothetical protein
MTLEHQDIEAIAIKAEKACDVSGCASRSTFWPR